jgi:protein TonB
MKKLLAIAILLSAFLVQTNNAAKNSLTDGGTYLATAEQMPAPVGGLAALFKKIKYPEIARQAHIQGKVYVMALVNENGGVDDVKILKGIGGGCNEAAIAAVKSTKFTPGKVKGKNVKVKVALPIIFKLK